MTDELDPETTPDPETAPAEVPEGSGPAEPEVDTPSGASAIFGPFLNAIVAPRDCWRALDAKPMLSVWIVVWIAVFSTAMSIYNMPITQRIMVESTRASLRAQGSEMSAEQMQQTQDLMMTLGTVFAYGSSIVLVVMIAITALAIWVLGSLMGGSGVTFGRAFGVAAGAAVIRPLLYSAYASVILNMNPPQIRRPEDATTIAPTLGLDIVFSGPDTPVWLHALMARVDLFLLWYAVLIVTGCIGVLKLSKGQGITVATVIWLFGTLLAVGLAAVQMIGAN